MEIITMRQLRIRSSNKIQVPILLPCIWLGLVLVPIYTCLGQTDDWRSLSAGELTQLFLEQERRGFDTIAKSDLINHTWSEYLANDKYLDTAAASTVIELARPIASSLHREQQLQLVSMLESRILIHPEIYADLSLWSVWRLKSIWTDLGVQNDKIYEWTRNWLMSADNWKQDAGHGEINMLLDWSVTVRNQAGYDMTGVLDEVYGYIRTKAITDPLWLDQTGTFGMKKMLTRIIDRITPEQQGQIRQNLTSYMVHDRGRFLVLDVIDMHRLQEIAELYATPKPERDRWVLDWLTHSDNWRSSTPGQLDTLYTLLNSLDDPADTQMAMGELARFAARKLADAPELDASQWYFRSLGTLFMTDEQRQYLTGLLIDKQGLPRANVARALIQAYKDTDHVNDWIALVEQAIQESASQPDRRALWFLIRAESATELDESPNDAMEWVNRAITAADSDEIRLECLEWVVNTYAQTGKDSEAVAFIKKHAPSFKDELFREQLNELEHMMAADKR